MRSRHFKNPVRRVAALAMTIVLVATVAGASLALAADAADRETMCVVNPRNGVLSEIDAELNEQLAAFLTAPINVRVKSADNEATPNALVVSYGKDSHLAVWTAQDETVHQAMLTKYGYDDIKMFAQIDWAIDDPKGWHYSDKWDSDTGRAYVDEEHPDEYVLGEWAYINCDCTTSITDTAMIFVELGNPNDENDVHWNNGMNGEFSKGWVSVLKKSQYTIVKDGASQGGDDAGDSGDGNKTGDNDANTGNQTDDNNDQNDGTEAARVVIDTEQHTVFVRVRYGVALIKKADDQQGNGGENGNAGENGNSGDNNSGENGSTGENGSAGNTGETGNTGDNNSGENGTSGETGNTGESGNTDDNAVVTKVYAFSEWSRTAAFGKEADNPMFRLDELFQAPVIENVSFLEKDENGFGPYLNYSLNISEEVAAAALTIEEQGGYTNLILEARHVGDTDWVELTDYRDIVVGENRVLLDDLGYGEDPAADAKPLELRGSFYIYGADTSEYSSPKSEPVSYTTDQDGNPIVTPEPGATPTVTVSPRSPQELKELLSATVEDADANHCKLCGVCPVQPLGICLFVWIGGIIIILVIIILIAKGRSETRRKPSKRRK